MKKLFVLLLALAVVTGAFAQVTTSVTLSGAMYLENSRGDGETVTYLAPDGSTYDTLKLKASKDDKFGFELYEKNVLAAIAIDNWMVWYDVGFAKFSFGQLDGGSYVQYFNNGWIENYTPTDNIARGLLVESMDFGGLKLAAFIPGDAQPTTGATVQDFTDIRDYYKRSVLAASYTIEDMAKILFQYNLGLTEEGVSDTSNVNLGFDFTGVEMLDVYGWVNYDFTGSGALTGGIGGQYKTGTFRAGAEFEMQSADDVMAFDVVGNVRYYVMPTLFVQARVAYLNDKNTYDDDPSATTTLVQYGDSRVWVKTYVNYAFGNGFAFEGMVGYDTLPITRAEKWDAALINYLRFTYSVSF